MRPRATGEGATVLPKTDRGIPSREPLGHEGCMNRRFAKRRKTGDCRCLQVGRRARRTLRWRICASEYPEPDAVTGADITVYRWVLGREGANRAGMQKAAGIESLSLPAATPARRW